jgi:hypothetical protein
LIPARSRISSRNCSRPRSTADVRAGGGGAATDSDGFGQSAIKTHSFPGYWQNIHGQVQDRRPIYGPHIGERLVLVAGRSTTVSRAVFGRTRPTWPAPTLAGLEWSVRMASWPAVRPNPLLSEARSPGATDSICTEPLPRRGFCGCTGSGRGLCDARNQSLVSLAGRCALQFRHYLIPRPQTAGAQRHKSLR